MSKVARSPSSTYSMKATKDDTILNKTVKRAFMLRHSRWSGIIILCEIPMNGSN